MNAMQKIALSLFGVLIVLQFAAIFQMQRSVSDLAVSVQTLSHTVNRLVLETERQMQPGHLYANWYSAGTPPFLREVDTERNVGESVADWEGRHDRAVAALRATYPPI